VRLEVAALASGPSDLIQRHFVGSAFEDRLYNTDNNTREKACAWKIMRSPHFQGLTQDSWFWRAVNIPLDLVDKSLQGDIDLLFATRRHELSQDGKHKFSGLYRSFELKTSKVSRDGDVKSLKRNKMHKVQGQLEKLCRIGSPQVFLLDVFIVEVGYSNFNNEGMPPAAKEAVAFKHEFISRSEVGYAVFAIEQIEAMDEDSTGMLWPTATIQAAETRPMGPSFRGIVDEIEGYIRRIGGVGYKEVISFCAGCKSLTHVESRAEPVCISCGRTLI
jgi:hypothetical protein